MLERLRIVPLQQIGVESVPQGISTTSVVLGDRYASQGVTEVV